MKSIFSKSWKASKQPRKQIKFRANAPNHILRKFMSAHLDKPLRKKYEMRSLEVRKGDEVKILRGKFRGKLGKISVVDVKYERVQVDGAQRAKEGGEKLETWFHPSNLKIISIDSSDRKRLKRNKKAEVKVEVAPKGVPSDEGKEKVKGEVEKKVEGDGKEKKETGKAETKKINKEPKNAHKEK